MNAATPAEAGATTPEVLPPKGSPEVGRHRSDRDPYVEVGTALRLAHRRMREGEATGTDWRTFSVIADYTASRSLFEDRIPQRVFTEAGIYRWDRDRSLVRLQAMGAIRYTASGGRAASTFGLPLPQPDGPSRPVEQPDGPSRPVPGPTGRDGEVQPDGHARHIREKQSEKSSSSDAHAHELEPSPEAAARGEALKTGSEQARDALAALLEGAGLAPERRLVASLLPAFELEPQRVEACVFEWRRRRANGLQVRSGLLVTMVRDGDWPGADGRQPVDPSAAGRRWVDAGASRLADDDFEALLAERNLTDEQADAIRRYRAEKGTAA